MDAEKVGHTPGEWFANSVGVVCVHGGYGINAEMPVKVAGGWREDAWHGHNGTDETRSNARIMAAAPAMLKALIALVPADFDEHPDDFMPEWHAARAAITAATEGTHHG